ncbi:MAG: hypothetical protein H0X39_10505 [Actinobacteria bacterium]|nr:hypothetical protein [Actinomycetota bacterium]
MPLTVPVGVNVAARAAVLAASARAATERVVMIRCLMMIDPLLVPCRALGFEPDTDTIGEHGRKPRSKSV